MNVKTGSHSEDVSMARAQAESRTITKWHGEIPLSSLYTAGIAGQVFLERLKAHGEIIGTRCEPCVQVYVPARRFCERCFAELTAYVPVKTEGTIKSFTYCRIGENGAHFKEPDVAVLVQLDGTTTVIFHRLLDNQDPSRVAIGGRVKAVIKPKSQRKGSILDIEGFRLVK